MGGGPHVWRFTDTDIINLSEDKVTGNFDLILKFNYDS